MWIPVIVLILAAGSGTAVEIPAPRAFNTLHECSLELMRGVVIVTDLVAKEGVRYAAIAGVCEQLA